MIKEGLPTSVIFLSLQYPNDKKMLVEFVCHELMGITAHRNLEEFFYII